MICLSATVIAIVSTIFLPFHLESNLEAEFWRRIPRQKENPPSLNICFSLLLKSVATMADGKESNKMEETRKRMREEEITQREQWLDQLLQCPVCLESFNHHDKQPRTLPCFHTVCLSDLETMVSQDGLLLCPLDRLPVPLSDNGVRGLPINFHLQDLIPIATLTSSDVTIHCDTCLDPEPATHRCVTCCQFLCSSHHNIHKKSKETISHKVSTLEEFLSQQSGSSRPPVPVVMCSKHQSDTLEFFCLQHNTPICLRCCVLDHQQCSRGDVKVRLPFIFEMLFEMTMIDWLVDSLHSNNTKGGCKSCCQSRKRKWLVWKRQHKVWWQCWSKLGVKAGWWRQKSNSSSHD